MTEGRIDLRDQYRQAEIQAAARETRRQDFANKIITYHQKLVAEGKPTTYILSRADIASALGINENSVPSILRNAFLLSANEVLRQLDLPYNPNRLPKF